MSNQGGRPKGIVMGVGINDADYKVDDCPFYNRWRGMLSRCYQKPVLKWYAGCAVCDEWLLFSNFKAWMEKQDWEGKELDKDLLFAGNRVYSPETCCFVTNVVNTFITDYYPRNPDFPSGVRIEKRTGKFIAQVRDPFVSKTVHVGTFKTIDEAMAARLTKKRYFAIRLAEMEKNESIAKALRERYAD